ncbi:MAG: TetM/TetW/TetO/TetS family tetracycline resistance ribosomal protection protein [Lachnospiraceae bacterium]|nr:TetM/TetW/TetO/TetS family tetracycline resistance ribosomal protection protein [Lachnospiraceae bacterium]
MEETSENKPTKHGKHICLGLLAHVDAGKTTLSESLLYESGALKKAGRVDKGDAFLDTFAMEKERGITIFSKQARLWAHGMEITLMDTPGHVDFLPEMERTLQVLDAALLVVSGTDGVQAHTRTLWKLLSQYDIPVILFINKMDQITEGRARLMEELHASLSEGCVDFTEDVRETEAFYESAAMCSEETLEEYLETGRVGADGLRRMIREHRLFPCYFGSALRQEGIGDLLNGICAYLEPPQYPQAFGARVYKIGSDEQGNRLTYLKVTGGSLKTKDMLTVQTPDGELSEKVNQIRLYSGARYETTACAEAGCVCAVTGPEHTFVGEGLGAEEGTWLPLLAPVLSYEMILQEGSDPVAVLPKLRRLAEEEPDLQIDWEEEHQRIGVKLMGEIQIQILQRLLRERFGLEVSFGPGHIVYKETIAGPVEGIGHFEPLRHYAEVHLLLEPGEVGSGLVFETDCSEDELDRNWQRLVLTHLREREHRGVLTGSAITDMKITLKSGRAHPKHTEGGDFRQATYRAVRQGLMRAQSVLLEPYYDFTLEVPDGVTGRAMTDLERLHAVSFQPEIEGGTAVLRGSAPVACLQGYQKEVTAYTKGLGRLTCTLKGYGVCHNAEKVLAERQYDPERDLRNPSASVFCAHGAGFVVPWDEVPDYMHLPSIFEQRREKTDAERAAQAQRRSKSLVDMAIGTEEINEILNRTAYANRKAGPIPHKGISGRRKRVSDADAHGSGEQIRRQGTENARDFEAKIRVYSPREKKPEYLLVDGYNIIFAWEELRELAEVNLDGARGRLLDILCNYQGIRGCELIAVFDAYRLKGHPEETADYHNIHVVYTREAETADRFIERFAHDNAKQYRISVATSDGLEQIIIRGAGCTLISARELEEEVRRAGAQTLAAYREQQEGGRRFLGEHFPKELGTE